MCHIMLDEMMVKSGITIWKSPRPFWIFNTIITMHTTTTKNNNIHYIYNIVYIMIYIYIYIYIHIHTHIYVCVCVCVCVCVSQILNHLEVCCKIMIFYPSSYFLKAKKFSCCSRTTIIKLNKFDIETIILPNIIVQVQISPIVPVMFFLNVFSFVKSRTLSRIMNYM